MISQGIRLIAVESAIRFGYYSAVRLKGVGGVVVLASS